MGDSSSLQGESRGAGGRALRLEQGDLRWCCDTAWLDFRSTKNVEPISGVIGQDDAVDALQFGLESAGPGQNIFVRGLTGTGRMTLVQQLLAQIRPECPEPSDRCYVRNFSQPDRPRLVTLPRGRGNGFRQRIDALVEFIGQELSPALSADAVRARRARLDQRVRDQLKRLGQPFEQELQDANLTVVPLQVGATVRPVILPLIDGKPMPIESFQKLRSEGAVSSADAERILETIGEFEKRFEEVSEKVQEIQDGHRAETEKLYQSEARTVLARKVKDIERAYPQESIRTFLRELIEDLVGERLGALKEDQQFTSLYRVNVVLSHDESDPCPMVMENAPTLENLLGNIEREFVPGGGVRSDHMMIKSGSLLRADGGFLIVEARDLISEPGAWKVLIRTLRTGKLEIVPSEMRSFWPGPMVKPEPIDIQVKVILLGDPDLYYLLDAHDRDFSNLFKVLADFDTTIERNESGVRYYAGVIAKIARDEGLLPFAAKAVAALVEHGARIASRQDRLTTRFGRLADVAREAAFIARKEKKRQVGGGHVPQAIRRNKRRADLPARRFRKLVAEGTIQVRVTGQEIGQVNGLAVTQAGPLTYGFPTRITSTIGAGTAGTINIEREAQLSGAIHTKGFYILGGLLRHLLKTKHPLAFSASIAFEQSYGGIDGDSASGAEMCCLLSALTGIPLRQELAMTGAIDQVGQVLAVGAVTEKVEGFFEICRDLGLTGNQGVILPRANARDLMLRSDVVEACGENKFHIYAVDSIHQALDLLAGREAGRRGEDGQYPENSLLQRAEEMAQEYWRMISSRESSSTSSPLAPGTKDVRT